MRSLIFVAAALSALLIAAPVARAEDAAGAAKYAPARIAVVDLPRIIRESKAGKGLTSAVEAKRKQFEESARKKAEELEGAQKELMRKKSVMEAAAFAAEQKKFAQKERDTVKDFGEKRDELNKMSKAGLDQISKAILEIVSDMAEKEGIDLVLNKEQIVMVRKTLDLTTAVVERLDKSLPKVNL